MSDRLGRKTPADPRARHYVIDARDVLVTDADGAWQSLGSSISGVEFDTNPIAVRQEAAMVTPRRFPAGTVARTRAKRQEMTDPLRPFNVVGKALDEMARTFTVIMHANLDSIARAFGMTTDDLVLGQNIQQHVQSDLALAMQTRDPASFTPTSLGS